MTVADDLRYDLTLFVSGASDFSASAIADARQLCEEHLTGNYHLTVVDLFQDPDAGLVSQVHVAPTLVKNRPLPARRLVGDLSRKGKVLLALGLPGGEPAAPANAEST
jgi:circadian clock protein KaiB